MTLIATATATTEEVYKMILQQEKIRWETVKRTRNSILK